MEKQNGSSSSLHNGTGPHVNATTISGSKPAAPQIRKFTGGIKVNTVKRVTQPPRGSPLPATSSSSSSPVPRINSLSDEKRQRVEEIRRERERKKREEEERLRPPRPKDTHSSKSTKRRKVEPLDSEDDNNDDDLFSEASTTSSRRKKKEGRSAEGTPINSNTGQGYRKLGRAGVLPSYLVPRVVFCEAAFENSSSEEHTGIQNVTLTQGKAYGPFFANLTEEQCKVTLEYPATGCREEFSLLVPKDRDEYDPISDLLRTVRCIVEHYLTIEEQSMFGPLDSLETGSAAGHILHGSSKSVYSRQASREPSVLGGDVTAAGEGMASPASLSIFKETFRESTPVRSSNPALDNLTESSSAPLSPARSAVFPSTSSSSSPFPHDSPKSSSAASDADSILRSLTKARNRRDGQLFIRTVDRFNTALQLLKRDGRIKANVTAMNQTGVPEGIWRCIQEQSYARSVAPRVEELSRYEAFSDNVYGELLPRFMSEIAQLTHLGPESVFVDLGSGVGNLLIQVALQTGSEAYGCEQMKAPSELATQQVREAQHRWRMWGLQGSKVQAWQGDFGEDDRVRDVLRRADVVLVNNYAFTAPTNDKLSWQFLDLKDGAQIVSLKPFVPSDFRLTERTLSSPLAILRVAQRTYTTGCVSWADGGGRYYIHTVDRSMITAFLTNR